MVTIAHLVAKRMNDLPFVQEAMDKEIINYGGLAEMIRPSIEKELKKKVKPSAVSMALRRFHEENKSKSHKRIRITKESDLSIKSNLFEISVQKSPKIFSALTKLYQSVDFGVGDVLNIIQGNYEVLVISNMKYKERFIETLSDENIIFTTENLAALSMTMPAQCISSPGFFFIITKTLAWEDINIVDMVNTATEVTLILDRKDVTRAYELLQDLLKEAPAD